ncbi:MAG: hypothetical protein FJY85_21565, partial [Deltaproteobacteria bacterium]|nr:hypothetical protein [Deltaproteobacteria bacterium]
MGRASKALLAPRAAMLFLIKLGAYLVVVVLFGVSVFVIYHGMERDVLLQFQALQQVDPLIEAKKLVEAGELCEALDYLDYFREYDYVKSDPRVAEFYDSIKQQRESYAYRAGDVFSGVWKGRGACFESLVAAAASDFVVVGDLRDLAWQGWNLYQGNDPDELTAALAGIGIVLAAATYGSGGAASPAKGVVSLLKTGNKLKKISAPLRKSLTALSREASKMRSLEPLEPAFSSIARIAKKKELKTRDLMEVLSRSKSVSELQFMENVAAAYGS